MPLVRGGRTIYGEAVGILLLDTRFPRLPGDVGNASTFDFPVRYKVISGASARRVVIEHDPALLEPFLRAARELEAEGVKAITTSCGFLALFQPQLADAVGVPVFTSSLMQVPLVHRMLRRDQKVGILTANSQTLTREILEAIGAAEVPHVVIGSENTPAVYDVFVLDGEELDAEAAERGLVEMATSLVGRHPEVGAFVSEDVNFSPFARAVQESTGRPFFDIITMTNWVFQAVVTRRYSGFM